MKPDDKNCFVGRSRCYLRMGLPQNALKDAEAALKEDESFPQVNTYNSWQNLGSHSIL